MSEDVEKKETCSFPKLLGVQQTVKKEDIRYKK